MLEKCHRTKPSLTCVLWLSVVKETVTQIREHHPIEKEFVVETRPTGREKELTERAQTEVSALGDDAL